MFLSLSPTFVQWLLHITLFSTCTLWRQAGEKDALARPAAGPPPAALQLPPLNQGDFSGVPISHAIPSFSSESLGVLQFVFLLDQ